MDFSVSENGGRENCMQVPANWEMRLGTWFFTENDLKIGGFVER